MKMNKKIVSRSGLIFLLLHFFIPGLTGAQSQYDPGVRELNQQKVVKNENGVWIDVQNILLSDLLQRIHDRSGIEFQLGNEVVDKVITTSMSAPTWTEAVRILLKGFNKVELWSNGYDLSRVVVLGVEDDEGGQFKSQPLFAETQKEKLDFSSHKDFDKTQNQQPYVEVAQAKVKDLQGESKVPLNIFQLRRLAKTPPGKALSNSLFQEPRSREFLYSRGINSPEDWRQIEKAKSIQDEAYVYLKILKKQRDAKRNEPQSN